MPSRRLGKHQHTSAVLFLEGRFGFRRLRNDFARSGFGLLYLRESFLGELLSNNLSDHKVLEPFCGFQYFAVRLIVQLYRQPPQYCPTAILFGYPWREGSPIPTFSSLIKVLHVS